LLIAEARIDGFTKKKIRVKKEYALHPSIIP
jgi:hypothetical protein